MKIVFLIILVSFSFDCFAQIPTEQYKTEISNLKTEATIDAYWKKLHDLDQVTYMQDTEDPIAGDSISLANMIRTALLFETYSPKIYKPNNIVPILNFSHNYNGTSLLAFWPIILDCKLIGGAIDSFGGQFPAYQLEGLSLTFYGYSLFNQDEKYPELFKKINIESADLVSTNLIKVFEHEKQLRQLEVIESLGKWTNKSFKDREDKGFFEFVKMNDDNIYVKRRHRLQKLILLSSEKGISTYKIEHEPFGWTYKLTNGNLSLVDDLNNILITYNSHK
ncbi:hypothetical protein WNY78_09525 [Psychroserpens sp. AS72]|uniref:hypothetical protein n=1 Tax=Psychroserpens sp. AS72 TaxID=3135775 RepID=UPI003177C0CD